jgi:tRNA-binding EMAP/Myf-like protein
MRVSPLASSSPLPANSDNYPPDDNEIRARLMKTAKIAPVKPAISIEILNKIDIRVGTIELVEDLSNSQRLVRLIVDFGITRDEC